MPAAASRIWSIAAGRPYRCTGMMAFVRGPMAAFRRAGSRLLVRSSASTNTGSAPVADTAAAVATNVFAGTMTSSPGLTPRARSTSSSAVEPDATPIACRTPQYSANQRSNSATSGPPMNADRPITEAIAASIAGFSCSYCSRSATRGIVVEPNLVNVIDDRPARCGTRPATALPPARYRNAP